MHRFLKRFLPLADKYFGSPSLDLGGLHLSGPWGWGRHMNTGEHFPSRVALWACGWLDLFSCTLMLCQWCFWWGCSVRLVLEWEVERWFAGHPSNPFRDFNWNQDPTLDSILAMRGKVVEIKLPEFFFFFLFGCTWGMWKLDVQGSNPCRSSDSISCGWQCQTLNCFAARELLFLEF